MTIDLFEKSVYLSLINEKYQSFLKLQQAAGLRNQLVFRYYDHNRKPAHFLQYQQPIGKKGNVKIGGR